MNGIIYHMTKAMNTLNKEYNDAYDDEIRMIERRRERNSSFSIEDLKDTLESLYIMDGNNIEGRSSVLQEVLSAQIAAHEAYIAKWEKEQ